MTDELKPGTEPATIGEDETTRTPVAPVTPAAPAPAVPPMTPPWDPISADPTATPAWLGDGGLADQQAAASIKTRLQVLEAVGAGRPLGRLAEPAEIASVIAFLCSERASYVTGSAWSADGGTVPIII